MLHVHHLTVLALTRSGNLYSWGSTVPWCTSEQEVLLGTGMPAWPASKDEVLSASLFDTDEAADKQQQQQQQQPQQDGTAANASLREEHPGGACEFVVHADGPKMILYRPRASDPPGCIPRIVALLRQWALVNVRSAGASGSTAREGLTLGGDWMLQRLQHLSDASDGDGDANVDVSAISGERDREGRGREMHSREVMRAITAAPQNKNSSSPPPPSPVLFLQRVVVRARRYTHGFGPNHTQISVSRSERLYASCGMLQGEQLQWLSPKLEMPLSDL